MSKPPVWTEDGKYLRLDTRWTYKQVCTEITWWPHSSSDAGRGHGVESADWNCTYCTKSCWGWRTECYACRMPRATAKGTSSDVLHDANSSGRATHTTQDNKEAALPTT